MTILSASTLIGEDVSNREGEDLGDIKDIMIDTDTGQVTYAVVEYGTVLGMGGKFFAIPMTAMQLDTENKCFILNQSKASLENAPGFDKDNWPDFADQTWQTSVNTYYDIPRSSLSGTQGSNM